MLWSRTSATHHSSAGVAPADGDRFREVVAAIQISSDIERIGDYAKNIAKRALNQQQPLRPVSIPRMGKLARRVVKDAGCLCREGCGSGARRRRSDEEIDEMYTSLLRESSPT
jgi:phosphate transport system protein